MKLLDLAFGALMAATVAAAPAIGPAAASDRISIGTGGTGGLFYVIGAGMADQLNKHLDNAFARAEVTGASIENIRRVAAGQMTFGFSSSSTLYEAKHGEGAFKQPQPVAAMAYLYPAVLQIVTIEGTGIKSFADLRGKRVNLGPPGSNSAVLAQRLLEAYGVFDPSKVQFLSYTEGTAALLNDNIDATAVLAGAPTSALIDLAAHRPMLVLTVDESKIGDLLKKYPFYQLYTIAPNTYSGQTQAVTVINDPATIFTKEDADPKLIHAITKTIFDHLDELKQVHPQAKAIAASTATKTPIPLHPGAKQYFDEAK
ncbi:TRAP transporter solute receptor, TAXI family precursor [Rhodovulum sp. PH10]|uniref:TAXI family TRAP transporter solute-binding subunit n=1 Tax=Rhodovulum sp. PH10 TaxID=1187851 RepID=UPI00027C2DF9|nr:TAXI family TRAP transporter solute-binding subunit [Rhodovulum sp. PH10]EJW09896.1 TRAP transporter solute receptor, TAXI family precursor [Rhodovulum sp. PH10]